MEVDPIQASTFNYQGKVEFKEVVSESLELSVRLDGAKSYTEYVLPAHLHFGRYNQANLNIAQVLNLVSSSKLKFTTQLGPLWDGRTI